MLNLLNKPANCNHFTHKYYKHSKSPAQVLLSSTIP